MPGIRRNSTGYALTNGAVVVRARRISTLACLEPLDQTRWRAR
jgi:hypothetical protein